MSNNIDDEGAYHFIYSKWLGPNHVNATKAEAEMALQMSTYDGEKMSWSWKKYVAPCQVPYYPCKYGIWETMLWAGRQ